MIFAVRGILVSLAFFAIVYGPLSLLVVLAWRSLNRIGGRSTAISANVLFGMRLFPFALSTILAGFFAFPSFWLMERTSLDEDAGTFILAGCSVVILIAGLSRWLRAQTSTIRAVEQWALATANMEAMTIHCDPATPQLSAGKGAPALLLAGIIRPRVMVSDMAALVLNDHELRLAIRHELGHKHAGDNLKKALISATPFPGMSSLERAWREAAELTADDAAVADRKDALDLAAALIKLSRSPKQCSDPALASGLVSGSASIAFRVKRLLHWSASSDCQPTPFGNTWPLYSGPLYSAPLRPLPRILLLLFSTIIGIAHNYGAVLVMTHRLTEFLVP